MIQRKRQPIREKVVGMRLYSLKGEPAHPQHLLKKVGEGNQRRPGIKAVRADPALMEFAA
jgi:hypothetical protein